MYESRDAEGCHRVLCSGGKSGTHCVMQKLATVSTIVGGRWHPLRDAKGSHHVLHGGGDGMKYKKNEARLIRI